MKQKDLFWFGRSISESTYRNHHLSSVIGNVRADFLMPTAAVGSNKVITTPVPSASMCRLVPSDTRAAPCVTESRRNTVTCFRVVIMFSNSHLVSMFTNMSNLNSISSVDILFLDEIT